MTQRDHARLLGLLFWLYVGFQFVISAIVTVVMFFMSSAMFSDISRLPRKPGEPNPEVFLQMMPFIMIFAFIIAVIMMLPKVIAGYGLRNDKSWAKIWAIVACCLACLNIPFGLAIGIYGFWFIFGEAGKGYFENQPSTGSMSQPPPHNWQ